MTPATLTLTAEQKTFFHAHGYLVLPTLTTPDEVARLRVAYDRIFAERAGRAEGNQYDLAGTDEEGKKPSLPQILSPSKYAPELAESFALKNAEAISRQLLGDDLVFSGDHAILKPAGHGAPTPWHQDEAYWTPDIEYHAVSIWMPLQEATPENGCLYFVPGSHTLEVLPHRSINNDPRIPGLETVPGTFDPALGVACPIPAGGCTIHAARTLHYAPPNRSATDRRAYIMGWKQPEKKRATPRDFPWQAEKRTARAERAAASGTKPGGPS